MKRTILTLTAVVLVAAAVYVGALLWNYSRFMAAN